MEEYRIFLMEQQGWYITQNNNLQQYDNRITSAPLGRCRGIINMNFSNGNEKTIKLSFSNNTKVYTSTHSALKMITYDSRNVWLLKIRVYKTKISVHFPHKLRNTGKYIYRAFVV